MNVTVEDCEFQELMANGFKLMTATRVRLYNQTTKAKEEIRNGKQKKLQDFN